MTNKALAANDGKPLPLYQKALCGLTAGAIGASVGSPADLALIRMQADATLPEAARRHYKNAFHALTRISKDEGVLALWKGAGPTVVRAMALNMGMLASYDQSVEFFRDNMSFGEIPTVIGEFYGRVVESSYGDIYKKGKITVWKMFANKMLSCNAASCIALKHVCDIQFGRKLL